MNKGKAYFFLFCVILLTLDSIRACLSALEIIQY